MRISIEFLTKKSIWAGLGLCFLLMAAPMARAVPILPGLYNLNNHPDGGARPPLYGARWDGLFTPSAAVVAATGSDSTIFTTNFDHPLSAMFMDYDDIAGTIHIFGTS